MRRLLRQQARESPLKELPAKAAEKAAETGTAGKAEERAGTGVPEDAGIGMKTGEAVRETKVLPASGTGKAAEAAAKTAKAARAAGEAAGAIIPETAETDPAAGTVRKTTGPAEAETAERAGETERDAMEVSLRETERIDDLQRNGLQIIQDPTKFCFGMDAVLLSGFAAVKAGERAIDFGTGNGIIPLLLSAKTEGTSFTGLEIQPEMAEMADRSVRLNGLSGKITIDCGDIREASERYGASSFDVVTSNPPYMIGGHGLTNPESAKAIARHEVKCTLDDIIRETAKILRPHGRCYFVHRPFRLVDIFFLMRQYGIEPKRMRLVYPYADREPNMVLIEGARGGNPRLAVEKPLVVYQPDGRYTDEIEDIYSF